MKKFNRRTLLRGALQGIGVGVALPLLDCFLDTNGKAFAATGARLPVRFGTWIWGCGFIPELWVPTTTGRDYAMPEHLKPVEAYRDQLAILSGFDVKLDGVPNKPHVTGCLGLRTGVPVPNENVKAPTLDVLIGDQIGTATRFRSLELSTSGVQRSYSYRAAGSANPSEVSPLALYQRIFGEGFQDPNAMTFTPDTEVMVRQSVLSAVGDERRKLMKQVGAADRQRLNEYFTSLRQLEQQLALQLEPPAPVRGFVMPDAPPETSLDSEMGNVMENHKLMAGLLARALQCNQTQVFNVLLSDTASNLRRPGATTTHHTLTHEEPDDKVLGYQKDVAWFAQQSMLAWRDFLDAVSAIPEGDGTLLDNCLVLAHSDCSIAKSHAVEGIPIMIAGSGGGRVKTGFHLAGAADPITRVGLTVQQAMGVQVEKWGALSMETNRTVTDLLS
ncbi:DUF1552 domain-containing protein [Pseudomaricurvus sp. HS19]|uniref:DUF1552 domain-containing protein n=1 Tax=Pseudomaricurvus sp. HS19 TaxID=2692626 RepID=UPI001370F95E|nr:DUF1552 domain-containing protein [Pseudomaricurvus sp. HS19]MYM62834.1 DUF1552 domain-containing protein [Pseudomaricurvus sp. HS19]